MALKTMLNIISILFAFSLVCSQAWADNSCQDRLIGQPLTDQQHEAILHAHSGDYKIAVLSGQINGMQKTVVLLGEAHVKNEEAKGAGRSVVKQFPLRGLEGASVAITWGGKALEWTVSTAYAFNKMFSLGKRKHSSTIDDAIETAEEDPLRKFINIPLEKGHTPDLAENMQSIILPAQMFTCGAAFCGDVLHYLEPGNAVSTVTTPLVWIVAGVGLSQTWAAKILRPRFKDQKWFKFVFAVNYGLINARDKTMVNNVYNALFEYKEEKAILVIVGKDHVDGMRDLLRDQFGFADVPLAKDKK